MTDAERPIHERLPGRRPLSRGRRQAYAVGLAAAILIVVVVAVVLATTSSTKSPRTQTLSAADRSAPAALRKAAADVGFSPPATAGLGALEDGPAAAAPAPSNADLLPVGSRAPAFSLRTPAGKTVSLADYRGKALLLEIFAAWCPHCAAEAPHLRALASSLAPKRYAVVAIDGSGEGAPTVFAYHVWFGLPFPALVDLDPSVPAATYPDHGTPGPVSKAYRLAYFPTFYVIDPTGKITWRSDGEQPDALLRQELQRAAG